jgi:hypothetical protein
MPVFVYIIYVFFNTLDRLLVVSTKWLARE